MPERPGAAPLDRFFGVFGQNSTSAPFDLLILAQQMVAANSSAHAVSVSAAQAISIEDEGIELNDGASDDQHNIIENNISVEPQRILTDGNAREDLESHEQLDKSDHHRGLVNAHSMLSSPAALADLLEALSRLPSSWSLNSPSSTSATQQFDGSASEAFWSSSPTARVSTPSSPNVVPQSGATGVPSYSDNSKDGATQDAPIASPSSSQGSPVVAISSSALPDEQVLSNALSVSFSDTPGRNVSTATSITLVSSEDTYPSGIQSAGSPGSVITAAGIQETGWQAVSLDASGNGSFTAHLAATGDQIVAVDNPANPTVTATTPAVTITDPPTITLSGPASAEASAAGAGADVTETVSAPGLTTIYESVITAAGIQETGWQAVSLDASGNGSFTAHLAATGDQIVAVDNPANPTVTATTPAVTITDPPTITLSGPASAEASAAGAGADVTETVSAPGLTTIYESVITAAGIQETGWQAVSLDASGNGSFTAHLAATGDQIVAVDNPANPTVHSHHPRSHHH